MMNIIKAIEFLPFVRISLAFEFVFAILHFKWIKKTVYSVGVCKRTNLFFCVYVFISMPLEILFIIVRIHVQNSLKHLVFIRARNKQFMLIGICIISFQTWSKFHMANNREKESIKYILKTRQSWEVTWNISLKLLDGAPFWCRALRIIFRKRAHVNEKDDEKTVIEKKTTKKWNKNEEKRTKMTLKL